MGTFEPAPVPAEPFFSSGFRRVLVCLDRSGAAEAALPLATHLAQLDGAGMTLLHVLEAAPDTSELHATDALEWEIAREEARVYLDGLAARARDSGVAASAQIAEGAAVQSVATAEADLIVVSAGGDTLIERAPMGSTAQKIVTVAPFAVLIMPRGSREPAPRVPLARVLVPLDGSVRGESVLPTVVRIARADHAEIVIAHVVPEPGRTELLSAPEDLALAGELADRLTRRAEAYLERIRSQLLAAGVKAHTSITRSVDHRDGLVAVAMAEQVDLVVMSAHGSVCNPKSVCGSVTSHVIAHAKTPVLVIQDVPPHAQPGTGPPSRLPTRSVDAAPGTV